MKPNPSALKILKEHGISLLPTEDNENKLITNALQSGRKIILSEAGKFLLNQTRPNKGLSFTPSTPVTSSNRMNLTPKPVNSQQVAQRFSPVIQSKTKTEPIVVSRNSLPATKLTPQGANMKVISQSNWNQILGTQVKQVLGKNVTVKKLEPMKRPNGSMIYQKTNTITNCASNPSANPVVLKKLNPTDSWKNVSEIQNLSL